MSQGLLPRAGRLPWSRQHVRQHITFDGWLMRGLIVLGALWLLVAIVLPLVQIVARSLTDERGAWAGAANYLRYFRSPSLSRSFANSLTAAIISTVVSVGAAFVFAYALTRTAMPGKRLLRTIAMTPLYAPSLAVAVALVYLFGTKGLATTGLLGALERLVGVPVGLDIHLYGLTGIVLGEVIYCFPQALMILLVALSAADARLYEASVALRASPVRTFVAVTLPGVKYGLVSAIFVCFTLAFTDFGVPTVVGGNYNVLATDIYKQVIGQQNFTMGATVSVLLLIPTVIAFVVDRVVQRGQAATITAQAVPMQARKNRSVDALALGWCVLIAAMIIIAFGAIILASVARQWPYDLTPSLRHYDFERVGGGGYAAYWSSLRVSLYSAVIGTVVTFSSAYVIHKGQGLPWLRAASQFISMLPVALPGLVIGLAYIFFFNPAKFVIAGISIANPFSGIYNTVAILVLANIVHFYTVGFLTASTALKQLDPEFETVGQAVGVPFYRTAARITIPLCLPSILDIGMYYFVNSMVTVSAVVFLVSPQIRLASVAVVSINDAGDTAAAAAMSVLIILTSVGVRVLYDLATRGMHSRTQAWRNK